MKTKLFFIAFLTFSLSIQGFSQSNSLFEIGEKDSLYSKILDESRSIWIEYPSNFNPNSSRKYPVLYLLDGDALLDIVSTVHRYYSGGFIPEMIIVGIANNENRTRDLTTSKIEGFYTENGEAEKFTQFIEKELIPFIEKKHPVTQYRTLIGHSYGGLFTINTLIHHRDLFQNYLAIDPSLDWDNQKLLKASKDILSKTDYTEKSLFITLGGQLHLQNSAITIDNVMEDSTDFTLFARSNIEFFELAKQSNNNLNSEWRFYKNDLHGTVPLPSVMDGLIYLFDWFQMENTAVINDFETPKDTILSVFRTREAKLKKHFDYAVPPYEEELINMLGYMYLEIQQLEKSLMFFQLNIEYYPNSVNVYDSIADYYEAQEDFKNAYKNAKKAFEIDDSDYYKERMKTFKKKR